MSPIDWGIFLAVMIQIESSGKENARGADDEIGCLQITEEVVQDVNRIYKLTDTDNEYWIWDAFRMKASKEICKKYLTYWGNKYEKDTKALGQSTFEAYARIWNGGPRGYKKDATDKYWEKFLAKAKEMGYELCLPTECL